MSLVSLGAASFTLCSLYGFIDKFDSSRMASNVASGVGFIGAGVITNNRKTNGVYDKESSVKGLTTAAAIWVSAAVGVCAGTGLYFLSATAVASTVTILRIGKRRAGEGVAETRKKAEEGKKGGDVAVAFESGTTQAPAAPSSPPAETPKSESKSDRVRIVEPLLMKYMSAEPSQNSSPSVRKYVDVSNEIEMIKKKKRKEGEMTREKGEEKSKKKRDGK